MYAYRTRVRVVPRINYSQLESPVLPSYAMLIVAEASNDTNATFGSGMPLSGKQVVGRGTDGSVFTFNTNANVSSVNNTNKHGEWSFESFIDFNF